MQSFKKWLESVLNRRHTLITTYYTVVKIDKSDSWAQLRVLGTHNKKKNIWLFNHPLIGNYDVMIEQAQRSLMTRLPLKCTIFKRLFNGSIILFKCDDTY